MRMRPLGVWKSGLAFIIGVVIVIVLLCTVFGTINLHWLSPCSIFVVPNSLVLHDAKDSVDKTGQIRNEGGRTIIILGRHFLPSTPSPSEHGALLELQIPVTFGHRLPCPNGSDFGQTFG